MVSKNSKNYKEEGYYTIDMILGNLFGYRMSFFLFGGIFL